MAILSTTKIRDTKGETMGFFEDQAKSDVEVVSLQQPAQKQLPQTPSEYQFQFKEATATEKMVVTIYGRKGDGKTTTAFSFPGKISAVSFDQKTSLVKKYYYNSDERIKVYDAVEFFDESPLSVLESGVKTYHYAEYLLDKIKEDKPDWIVIDGLEILIQMAEYKMRQMHKLSYNSGVPMQYWKDRKLLIRNIHNKAVSSAKKGVIYTTYVDKDEVIKDSEFVARKDVPKWNDVILYVTDVVLRVDSQIERDGKKFILIVDNSKIPVFKTGMTLDITSKKDWIKL